MDATQRSEAFQFLFPWFCVHPAVKRIPIECIPHIAPILALWNQPPITKLDLAILGNDEFNSTVGCSSARRLIVHQWGI